MPIVQRRELDTEASDVFRTDDFIFLSRQRFSRHDKQSLDEGEPTMYRFLTKALVLSAIVAATAAQAVPANANISSVPANAPQAGHGVLNAGAAKRSISNAHIKTNASPLNCGVQFSSWIAPNDTQQWFTFGYDPSSYIDWTVMDDTPWDNGKVSLTNVAEDRNDTGHLTYWLTVQNQSSNWKLFEGRFCYLQ